MQRNGKFYITLKGVHYEVSQEVHDAYYQEERKERYMAEKDQSHNLVILNRSGREELEWGAIRNIGLLRNIVLKVSLSRKKW